MTENKTKTNVIAGFLGVGKTTAIRGLAEQKPRDKVWAILVNEFGEVGVDGALLEGLTGDKVQIREITGGCLCCTAKCRMAISMSRGPTYCLN